jgi:hypothetical protein
MKNQSFRILSIVLLGVWATSCNQATQTQVETNALTEDSILNGIYAYRKNGDTITLKLRVNDGVAAGDLIFALKEKDRNMGSINGSMNKDLLLADYTFLSEGINSVRQVAFKIKNDSAWQAYGEMEESAGKFIFKNPDSLQFDEKFVLVKE